MRSLLPWLLVPAAVAAIAWLLLGGADPAAPTVDAASRAQRGPDPAPAREARTGLEAPPAPPSAPPTVPDDPEWATRPLRLPPGDGPLTGRALIAAVEGASPLRFRGATPADLEALERAELTDIDRAADLPRAAMLGWLKEAGFEVEAQYPVLVVRRRTDDDYAQR